MFHVLKKTVLSKKSLPSFLDYLNIKNVTPITGDGGHRTYYRLTSSDSSYVLMYDAEIKQNYKSEHTHTFSFVNVHNLLEKNNISVPSIKKIFKNESCLLLEDLGSFNLYNTKNDTLNLYKQSLKELVKIQNIKKNSNLPMFQKSFNADFLIQELVQSLITINNFYYPKNLLSILSQKLITEVTAFCNFLAQSPFCLVHRDYHSRNIMVTKGQIKIIDFQDARLGHSLYDLSSLLEDPYTKLSSNTKDCLKKYFQQQTSILPLNDFDNHYYRISIHRLLKAAASFIKLSAKKNNKIHNYLIDLPYAIKQSYHYTMKIEQPELKILISAFYNYK